MEDDYNSPKSVTDPKSQDLMVMRPLRETSKKKEGEDKSNFVTRIEEEDRRPEGWLSAIDKACCTYVGSKLPAVE